MLRTVGAVCALLAAAGAVWAAIQNITATPATVTFQSADPDLSPVAGSPVTVTWRFTGGNPGQTWNVGVSASSPAMTNCGGVPASAITVSCRSVSMSGGSQGTGSWSCSQPFPLSTTNQQVAGGRQMDGNANYAVDISYSFQDSWRYRGAVTPACSLTLTYTVYFQ
jgi:hypothetical protein